MPKNLNAEDFYVLAAGIQHIDAEDESIIDIHLPNTEGGASVIHLSLKDACSLEEELQKAIVKCHTNSYDHTFHMDHLRADTNRPPKRR